MQVWSWLHHEYFSTKITQPVSCSTFVYCRFMYLPRMNPALLIVGVECHRHEYVLKGGIGGEAEVRCLVPPDKTQYLLLSCENSNRIITKPRISYKPDGDTSVVDVGPELHDAKGEGGVAAVPLGPPVADEGGEAAVVLLVVVDFVGFS